MVVVPITTVFRNWPNHVQVSGPGGLEEPSWIMTEQPRTLARERLTRVAGQVSGECLASVRMWLEGFLVL